MEKYFFTGYIGKNGSKKISSGDNSYLAISFGVKDRVAQKDGSIEEVWKTIEGTWSKYPESLIKHLLPKTKVLVELTNVKAISEVGTNGTRYTNIKGNICQIEILGRRTYRHHNLHIMAMTVSEIKSGANVALALQEIKRATSKVNRLDLNSARTCCCLTDLAYHYMAKVCDIAAENKIEDTKKICRVLRIYCKRWESRKQVVADYKYVREINDNSTAFLNSGIIGFSRLEWVLRNELLRQYPDEDYGELRIACYMGIMFIESLSRTIDKKIGQNIDTKVANARTLMEAILNCKLDNQHTEISKKIILNELERITTD